MSLLAWAEGMVWCSPGAPWLYEFHLSNRKLTGFHLAGGAIRATQGKTLALMQVSGGSQSFNSSKPDAYFGAVGCA